MSLQLLTYLFVGITFLVYIGIAIWSRASSTQEFYIAGAHVPPRWPMAWRLRRTGCQRPRLFPWRASCRIWGAMARFI